MSKIERGVVVVVQDATGEWLRRRALTGVVQGADFPGVWTCREEEWTAAHAEGRKPDGVPWPAEDVHITAD